jgi:hypothetical protein
MTFERTTDYALVRRILTDAGIYGHMTDDFAPKREEFCVNMHEAIWYVTVREGPRLYGLFCFFPENAICWAAHVALLRRLHPAVTWQAGREVVEWLWGNTGCLRLIASVPVCSRAAVRFGLRAMGMKAYGRNKASFRKGGKLWDQVLMGKSKESFLPSMAGARRALRAG